MDRQIDGDPPASKVRIQPRAPCADRNNAPTVDPGHPLTMTDGSSPDGARSATPQGGGHGAALDLLLVSSYYWPETAGNAPYVTGIAEYLANRGHRVTVATGFAHYPEWKSSAHGLLGVSEQRNGVAIRRRRHYVPHAQSVFTRALYEASLYATGLTAFPARIPDAVVGVTPTLAGAVLAYTAATLYGRPYGLIFQDLQGRGALQSGVEGGRTIASLVELTETRLARRAAAVGVIADGFRPYFEQRAVAPERIHHLRNWSQDAEPTETIEETRDRLGWSSTDFVCLHAGNMGHKQGLENVLRSATTIADPDVRIVLAGEGNERTKLQSLASQLRLANVTFLPPQPTGKYESMLRAADVLLVNQRATVGDMSLASKLTSYFMAARPVVGAVAESSETARELKAAQAGLLAPPDDPGELANAIAWVKEHRDEADRFGGSARRYAEQHLSPAQVLREYEAFVETVRDGQAPRRQLVSRDGRPWRYGDPRPSVIEPESPGPDSREATLACVIVSFECRDALVACLDSLERERAALPLEVVVVDNASRDGTVPVVVERFPWVHVVENHENVGFAHAANEAMALADTEYVLFLNPDTVVPRGSIAEAVAELERHPDVGMLGCKLVRPDGTFDHACKRGFPTIASSLYYFFGLAGLRPSSARFGQYIAGQLGEDETGFVDAINGAFMLVRRTAAEEVGPMDERYWLYAEDLDWCHRFWEAGWKILYWPRVEVVHRKGGSTGDYRTWALNRAFHRSMWLFYEKHLAPTKPRVLSALVWAGVWTKFSLSTLRNAFRKRGFHASPSGPG
jgi:colanic acid biosynthesis glycosyl transferase WcaI